MVRIVRISVVTRDRPLVLDAVRKGPAARTCGRARARSLERGELAIETAQKAAVTPGPARAFTRDQVAFLSVRRPPQYSVKRAPSETGPLPGARQLSCCLMRKKDLMFLRPAEPSDAIGVARVHVSSWQRAYRNLLSDDYLDQLRPEDRAPRYTFGSLDPRQPSTIVATEHAAICGFATTAPARDPDALDHGELCALYVDPNWWGHGVGAALVSAARARLLSLGFRHAILWVMVGNSRVERFYKIDRWVADGLRRTDSVWGVKVDEVRYRRALEGAVTSDA